MGWVVVLEKTALMAIWRGEDGTRRMWKSTRNFELSTWISFLVGRALVAGSEDAKFHSSSSAAAWPAGCWGAPPARSNKDEDAGWACAGGGWNAPPDGRGLADMSEANGSDTCGGVAVDRAWGEGLGLDDCDIGCGVLTEARRS